MADPRSICRVRAQKLLAEEEELAAAGYHVASQSVENVPISPEWAMPEWARDEMEAAHTLMTLPLANQPVDFDAGMRGLVEMTVEVLKVSFILFLIFAHNVYTIGTQY